MTPYATTSQVKAMRAKLGLSQAALAQMMGLKSGRTVRMWEAGDRPCEGPAALLLTALYDGWRP